MQCVLFYSGISLCFGGFLFFCVLSSNYLCRLLFCNEIFFICYFRWPSFFRLTQWTLLYIIMFHLTKTYNVTSKYLFKAFDSKINPYLLGTPSIDIFTSHYLLVSSHINVFVLINGLWKGFPFYWGLSSNIVVLRWYQTSDVEKCHFIRLILFRLEYYIGIYEVW